MTIMYDKSFHVQMPYYIIPSRTFDVCPVAAECTRTSFNHTAPQLSQSSHRDIGVNDEFRKGSKLRLQTAPDILNCEHQDTRFV